MNVALNNFVGNDLGCAGVVQHMLDIADEQQILVTTCFRYKYKYEICICSKTYTHKKNEKVTEIVLLEM